MISKEEYAEWLPTRDRWGTPGKIYDIEIIVSGDKASLKCYHVIYKGWAATVTSDFVKENDTWYIMNLRSGSYR